MGVLRSSSPSPFPARPGKLTTPTTKYASPILTSFAFLHITFNSVRKCKYFNPQSFLTSNLAMGKRNDEMETSYFMTTVVIVSGLIFVIILYLSCKYLKKRRDDNQERTFTRKKLKRATSSDSFPCGSNLKISHSLPDIQHQEQSEVSNKKNPVREQFISILSVLRQTTLPTVPSRHESFQRQLSHKLDAVITQMSVVHKAQRIRSTSLVGAIMPELYRYELMRQDSDTSTSENETEAQGKLHFTLRYDDEIDALVIKATDLPAKDFSGTCDPYIKMYLLPDRKKKFQSKVLRKNLNPVWNEMFIYSVDYSELHSRVLQFSVYDFDRFSRHDLIGQVVLKGLLHSSDLRQEVEYQMDILATKKDKLMDIGELMISLCYLPTAGRLTVTIIKARNLKPMDLNGKSDPYIKGTLNPVYNEAFVFDVPSQNIDDVSLQIKVIDYDRIGSNELMGCCNVGPRVIGTGGDHWIEMLANSRRPVAQWYPMHETPAGTHSGASSKPTTVTRCINYYSTAQAQSWCTITILGIVQQD
uniref:C2 domain-containing protein n=1 Tax=Strigamia maritima TaxID=126957 RepID=T1IQ10_STRMM